MPEMLTIYEPGDQFATMSGFGQVRIYEVNNDGLPVVQDATVRRYRKNPIPDSPPMVVYEPNVIEQRLDHGPDDADVSVHDLRPDGPTY